MIFNFYIYNRKGKLLYYKEWNRPLNTLADDIAEERRLMFGMLFSMKDLVGKLGPAPAHGGQPEGLHTIRTDTFALHHFQSASGIMFVLNTDPTVDDLYSTLQYIYSQIFIEYVTKNPLYEFVPDQPIDCPLFARKLDEYMFRQTFSR